MTNNLDVLGGITDLAAWKNPCAVATIVDMTDDMIGLPVIDGYQTEADDRILVRANTDQTTNGIFNAALSAWTPAIDFAFNSGVVRGTQILVTGGNTFTNVIFQVTTPNPVIVGDNDITFAPLVPVRPTASAFRYVSSGDDDTMLGDDNTIAWNSPAAAPKTENIFSASSVAAGFELTIKDGTTNFALSAGVFPITIVPAAGTIDGGASAIINSPGGSKTIVADGISNWLSKA